MAVGDAESCLKRGECCMFCWSCCKREFNCSFAFRGSLDTVTIFGPGDFDVCGDPCCRGTLYADGLAVAGAMGVTFCFTRGDMVPCVGQWLWSCNLAFGVGDVVKLRGLAVTEVGFPPLKALETSWVTALGDGTVICELPTPLGDWMLPRARLGLLGVGVTCLTCDRELRTAAKC